jgi:aminopeptidase-like protein
MKKVWDVANKIGYQDFFIYDQTNRIIDDHYYINDIINIPTIDIIHHDPNTRSGFFKHWHTIHDNIDVIDPATLKVVGQTVLTVIFEEK